MRSEIAVRGNTPVRRLAGLFVAMLLAATGSAQEVATREEALAGAFPGATISPERIFLTEQEIREASALAGTEISSALIARYTARKNGAVLGRAYVDTQSVGGTSGDWRAQPRRKLSDAF